MIFVSNHTFLTMQNVSFGLHNFLEAICVESETESYNTPRWFAWSVAYSPGSSRIGVCSRWCVDVVPFEPIVNGAP